MRRMISIGILLCVLLAWANVATMPAVQVVMAGESSFQAAEYYDVPVLLYHHISDIKEGYTNSDKFAEDLDQLQAAGYETIFFEDLYNYVYDGQPLPEKPLVITFDDGYLSNYKIAYPLLAQRGMKAEIAIIGGHLGQSYGEDHWLERSEYFTWTQAKEMQDSGVIRLQNHTYNMHLSYLTKERDMRDCLRQEWQTWPEYQNRFIEDHSAMQSLFASELGNRPLAFVYPLGHYDEDTENLLDQLGYPITATTKVGINRIAYGDPESLKELKRISGDNVWGSIVELVEFSNDL